MPSITPHRAHFRLLGEIDDVAMKSSSMQHSLGFVQLSLGVAVALVTVSAAAPAAADVAPMRSTSTATLDVAADASATAVRVDPPHSPANQLALPVGAGLHGRPFAPEGLSGCEEMSFYRVQWGLPVSFDSLGWRESGCRNEDMVRTSCCVGYWQLYVSSFVRDLRAGPRLADECAVYSAGDVDSDTALDKQRQACAAAVVYSIQGFGAWSI